MILTSTSIVVSVILTLSIVTEIDESIRPGDELQIKKNDYTILTDPDPRSKTQRMRTVTEIASSDTVRTDIYFGSNSRRD